MVKYAICILLLQYKLKKLLCCQIMRGRIIQISILFIPEGRYSERKYQNLKTESQSRPIQHTKVHKVYFYLLEIITIVLIL